MLQILVNHIDFGQTLPDALAAPRASQRNASPATPVPAGVIERTEAEQTFIDADGEPLRKLGHSFTVPAAPGEIGAATGIRFFEKRGRQQAVAEPSRRGGGSAMVVHPG